MIPGDIVGFRAGTSVYKGHYIGCRRDCCIVGYQGRRVLVRKIWEWK